MAVTYLIVKVNPAMNYKINSLIVVSFLLFSCKKSATDDIPNDAITGRVLDPAGIGISAVKNLSH